MYHHHVTEVHVILHSPQIQLRCHYSAISGCCAEIVEWYKKQLLTRAVSVVELPIDQVETVEKLWQVLGVVMDQKLLKESQ